MWELIHSSTQIVVLSHRCNKALPNSQLQASAKCPSTKHSHSSCLEPKNVSLNSQPPSCHICKQKISLKCLWQIHTLCRISVSFVPKTHFPKGTSLDNLTCRSETVSSGFSLKSSVTLLAGQAPPSLYSDMLLLKLTFNIRHEQIFILLHIFSLRANMVKENYI